MGEHAGYDIVMASKFLNEFYRKDKDLTGLYSRFIAFGSAVLNPDGILMITELTDGLPGHGYLNKAFTQVFCRQSSGRQFYDQAYLNQQQRAPIRIKYTGWKVGHFCYQGKLRDTAQLS